MSRTPDRIGGSILQGLDSPSLRLSGREKELLESSSKKVQELRDRRKASFSHYLTPDFLKSGVADLVTLFQIRESTEGFTSNQHNTLERSITGMYRIVDVLKSMLKNEIQWSDFEIRNGRSVIRSAYGVSLIQAESFARRTKVPEQSDPIIAGNTFSVFWYEVNPRDVPRMYYDDNEPLSAQARLEAIRINPKGIENIKTKPKDDRSVWVLNVNYRIKDMGVRIFKYPGEYKAKRRLYFSTEDLLEGIPGFDSSPVELARCDGESVLILQRGIMEDLGVKDLLLGKN